MTYSDCNLITCYIHYLLLTSTYYLLPSTTFKHDSFAASLLATPRYAYVYHSRHLSDLAGDSCYFDLLRTYAPRSTANPSTPSQGQDPHLRCVPKVKDVT